MESRIIQAPRPKVRVNLSNRNELLDLIASLRHGSEREKTGLFFVEGSKMVGEALSSRVVVEAIVVCAEMRPRTDRLPARWEDLAALAVDVPRRRYESATRHFALKQGPQGIGALVWQRWTSIDRFTPPADAIAVALSSVQDAGNVGTMLRTCDAVGCSAVFIVGETADPYGPSAVRASLGSVFSHTLMKCDFSSLFRWAKITGATVTGASPRAERSYRETRYKRPMVLVLGNEAKGLSDEELGLCNQIVSIPMAGRRDSLNVAVAGAVILYEAFSQSAENRDVRD